MIWRMVDGRRQRASRSGSSVSAAVGDVGSAPGVELAIGSGDHEGSVACEVELPAAFVDDMVMPGTQRDQILEIGQAAELPRKDVVDLAAVEHHVAAVEGTAAIHRLERSPLSSVGVADLTAHVERSAVLIDDHRRDPALAHQSAYRGRRERSSIGGLADAVVVEFARGRRVGIDDQRDVGLERAAPAVDRDRAGLRRCRPRRRGRRPGRR